MFNNNNTKLKHLVKEVVKMKSKLLCLVFVMFVFCATNVWAATSGTVNVNAVIPALSSGLTVTIIKIVGGKGGAWSVASAINFGQLVRDPVNNIFTTGNPGFFYAVDASVLDNSGNDWTITHTRASLKKDAVNDLDDNVNVSFCKVKKVPGEADSDISMDELSFANSDGKFYKKSQLGGAGCWLRVYYGIATGLGDAVGVVPIGIDKPAGSYAGTVTLTYSP